MKELFIVAGNAFTISAPDNVTGIDTIMPRFMPFVASEYQDPALNVEITAGVLPELCGETIYEPDYDGIGAVIPRTFRTADGALGFEFSHVKEQCPRLTMTMTQTLTEAKIFYVETAPAADALFLSHALMIAYVMATAATGTLLMHASAVVSGGSAYLFQGRSGTGKSTHSQMWLENIAGTELLNDDHPAVRFSVDGTPMAYGTPWSGKTDCYRNSAAPIGGFVRIVRSPENELKRLSPLMAYASLTASVFYLPFMTEVQRDVRHRTIERLAAMTPCCDMNCRPDADAAIVCSQGLLNT
nr:hypothetical protein [Bacteroides sp.]